ncbi:MAG: MBL fold metallo-hydrolase [Vicinamibacterales bacterium]
MNAIRITRALVALASLTFAAFAVAIWAAPVSAAGRLGLGIARTSGAAALRAEIGGLFGGMAALAAAAAWTRGRTWSLALASVVGGVAFGRAVGWAAAGVDGDGPAMAIELSLLAASLVLAAKAAGQPAPTAVRRSRRVATAAAAATLAVGAAGAVVMTNPAVQRGIFDRAAEARTSTVNAAPLQDDALRVAVCGSSAPLPSPSRAKACVAVFAGGRFYVVDAGPESVENLVLWGIPLQSVGGALLTHFHSDHIGDLGELNLQTWAAGRPGPLVVYGGPGVEHVVDGFNAAYRLDQGYRTAHHTAKVMPPETWPMEAHTVTLDGPEMPAKGRTAVVLERDGLRITAVEVDHTPIAPAYAYRFDYKGRSAFVTGDLKFHPELARAADGVDVMVSEAIAVQMTRALGQGARSAGRDRTAAIMHDIEDYHITPEQAARIANDARVRLLVFYHLLPAPDGALTQRVFAQGLDAVRKDGWALAEDGSLYTLPVGSTDVRIGRVAE